MAKNKWPKMPRFYVPLFKSANVYLARSRDEWDSACKHLGVPVGGHEQLGGCCQQYTSAEDNENLYLVGVFNDSIATLAHECAHAVFGICADVGVTTDAGQANETYCYLLHGLFEEFLPHIKQYA